MPCILLKRCQQVCDKSMPSLYYALSAPSRFPEAIKNKIILTQVKIDLFLLFV